MEKDGFSTWTHSSLTQELENVPVIQIYFKDVLFKSQSFEDVKTQHRPRTDQ